jgi:hypothetical protein
LRSTGEWHVDHRTDGHVYAVSTPDSVAFADLRRAEAVAFVGPRMLSEPRAIRRDLVEGLSLAMATGGRGYCTVHAAGVARSGLGIGLLGPAGAGKSTLTMAAARRGFDVFAEDAIYARAGAEGLEFWGLPWIQRLLPDAMELFPELEGARPMLQANGESKLEVDLDERFPGRAVPRARPAALVLLSRQQTGRTRLSPAHESERADVELLWPWDERSWGSDHQRAADAIAQLPIYRLEVGGTPEEALDALEPLLDVTAGIRLAS